MKHTNAPKGWAAVDDNTRQQPRTTSAAKHMCLTASHDTQGEHGGAKKATHKTHTTEHTPNTQRGAPKSRESARKSF